MTLAKQMLAFFTIVAGFAVAFLACSVPVYFTAVDKYVVSSAGDGSKSVRDVALLSLDSAKVSSALIFSRSVHSLKSIESSAKKLLQENTSWSVSGGDAPFFETFCGSLDLPKGEFVPVFETLAARENRKSLANILSQSKSIVVKKILDLSSLNTVLLPPAYSSAGAPFEASLLTLALLVQSGDLNSSFLLDLSGIISAIGDSRYQEDFEKCVIGALALSKVLDYSALSSLFNVFERSSDVYSFAKIYASQKNEYFRDCMFSATLLSRDAKGCVGYLSSADLRRWGNVSYALDFGEGSVKFLFNQNQPIYENTAFADFLDSYCAPMKHLFASVCVKNLKIALALKVFLVLVGFSMVAIGLLRLLRFRRSSAFFTVRSVLIGAVFAVLFWASIEPSAFEVKIQNSTSAEIKIAFDKIKSNIVGDKDMLFSIDTDSATLVAIALFFVTQLIVYVVCLTRINVIKRTRASASLKLKLLDNEDNLFDLGLYIGLFGTVASLVLLTFGVITASLMAGYTSTLFGILFTATTKIVHLRKFKRKLLIEAANEQNS